MRNIDFTISHFRSWISEQNLKTEFKKYLLLVHSININTSFKPQFTNLPTNSLFTSGRIQTYAILILQSLQRFTPISFWGLLNQG